jgi:membrane-associated phospholipid phosphatase
VAAGNLRCIPLLGLVLIAVLTGVAVHAAVRRSPLAQGRVVDAARDAGEGRPALDRALDEPEQVTGIALGAALLVILLAGVALAALAFVVRDTNALAGVDGSVARWGDRHATGQSTDGLHVVTAFGETWMAVAVALVIVTVDARVRGAHARTRGAWRTAAFLVVVIGGDKLVTSGLKHLIDRARPDLNPVAATLGPSFPSGHSSTAAALWLAVAIVASRWWGARSWAPLIGTAVGIAVAVAASRVLLDVHWLTDVVAGLILGWAWCAICAIAFGGRVLRFGATAWAARRGTRAPPLSAR